ncbi:sugar phosphate isomerase/epimerase family protein [Paenibacillus piri]|uniref:Sugar phosphate isomerase/epimerase n=1 Tax=Paenibacillus piri TaxID=2547395 RepID=A0A4R5K8S5_9BACL|nr:TIM barrel protein [Paenibacillus piri]TDF91212.1 sugar phosphate isomerase/epimerase [Paenibacillus piri]
MSTEPISFSVFTKPWKALSMWELGTLVSGMGFDGVEFPLRDGYQLEPANADRLPQLVEQFAEFGLTIYSVASGTDERIFAGCAEAGIPMIRMMPSIDRELGYMASEKKAREQIEALLPLCEKYGIKVGCQQHYGNHIVDAMGLHHLLEDYDPNYVGAIWDSAHDALAGQQPEFGLDIVWSHLCMVNFKNAYYKLLSGPEAEAAEWKRYFTSARHGLASWSRAAAYLKKRSYRGVVCLTAEYTNEQEVDRLIRQDIDYAKSLFAGG